MADNRWLALPSPLPVLGGSGGTAQPPPPPPAARSSHRAVALADRIVIHGGSANERDPDRLADVATLVLQLPASAGGGGRGAAGTGGAATSSSFTLQLHWSTCDQPDESQPTPTGKCELASSLCPHVHVPGTWVPIAHFSL